MLLQPKGFQVPPHTTYILSPTTLVDVNIDSYDCIKEKEEGELTLKNINDYLANDYHTCFGFLAHIPSAFGSTQMPSQDAPLPRENPPT